MPSWIGPWEIAIVLVLALLIFGPKKLPDLGSSLGRSITGFKKGLKETQDDVKSAIKEDVTAEAPASAEAPIGTDHGRARRAPPSRPPSCDRLRPAELTLGAAGRMLCCLGRRRQSTAIITLLALMTA